MAAEMEAAAKESRREHLAALLLSMWKEGASPLQIVDAILSSPSSLTSNAKDTP